MDGAKNPQTPSLQMTDRVSEATHYIFDEKNLDTSRGVRDAHSWEGGRGDNPYERAWGEYLKGLTLEGTFTTSGSRVKFTPAKIITWDSLPQELRDKADSSAKEMKARSYGMRGGNPFDLSGVYVYWTYRNGWNSCNLGRMAFFNEQ